MTRTPSERAGHAPTANGGGPSVADAIERVPAPATSAARFVGSKLHRVYEVLLSVNQALVRLRDPEAIFREVCRIIVEDGGCMAWIGLVSPDDPSVRPVAWAGASTDYIDHIHSTLGDETYGTGPTAAAISTGHYVVHSDIDGSCSMPPWAGNALSHGYRSCASFPLVVAGETRGALSIYSETAGYFDEAQVELLDELAADISFALEVAETQASRDAAEEKLAASELKYATAFRTSPDAVNINRLSDGLYIETNDGFTELTGYTNDDVAGKTSLDISIWDDPADRDRLVAGLNAEGVVKNLEARFRRKDGSVTTGLMSARVIDVCGVPSILSVTRDISERKEAEEEAARAKAKLEEALAREQTLARSDVLTGVNNRRYWFELAEHEFEVATRYRHPLSVILFDVDGFKPVNDTFGHAVGDEMLERIAHVASGQLRAVDIMGRYGGEEFVVLLPATGADRARPIAERIRTCVGAIRLETPSGDVAVTLSLGIAELAHVTAVIDGREDSLDALIDRADTAMYAAKAAGGDRISVAGR
jgi:diguanylate cyclase (GGDEF)-like protein/PAS domain S-box-containing protein